MNNENSQREPAQPVKTRNIPRATIRRLATYVQVLENLARENIEVVTSNPLAEACGVNGSQVRKDLAYFGEFGIRGVGYQVRSLIASITSALGVDREWRMALIGVGNLGRAILNHAEFKARGFNIVGIFDCDPFKIGEKIHGLEVHCTKDLPQMVPDLKIEIGLITTPPERAQKAAQHILDAGLTSILNFAPARIKVPSWVHVEYVDFFHHLYSLAFKHNPAIPRLQEGENGQRASLFPDDDESAS